MKHLFFVLKWGGRFFEMGEGVQTPPLTLFHTRAIFWGLGGDKKMTKMTH